MSTKRSGGGVQAAKRYLLPSQEWLRWMREKWLALKDQRGATTALVKASGVARAHVYRFFDESVAIEDVAISFDAMERLRRAMVAKFGEAGSFPAFDPIADLEEWDWIELGRDLRRLDPEFYSNIYERMREKRETLDADMRSDVRIDATLKKEIGKDETASHRRSIIDADEGRGRDRRAGHAGQAAPGGQSAQVERDDRAHPHLRGGARDGRPR